jgi:hypothetical protein
VWHKLRSLFKEEAKEAEETKQTKKADLSISVAQVEKCLLELV